MRIVRSPLVPAAFGVTKMVWQTPAAVIATQIVPWSVWRRCKGVPCGGIVRGGKWALSFSPLPFQVEEEFAETGSNR